MYVDVCGLRVSIGFASTHQSSSHSLIPQATVILKRFLKPSECPFSLSLTIGLPCVAGNLVLMSRVFQHIFHSGPSHY